MSSPIEADEDEVEEVEFVSEGPLRPVLECIDLLSDSDDEGCSSWEGTLEDKINSQKRRVTSTLDRLAHQVALEKKERANKCKAFKEKQISQRAHGQQELAFSPANGVNREAKRCVDMWLKMPGLKPGMISSGFGRRPRATHFPRASSSKHNCPVINCGRVFDNPSLLGGHLKRFDHSPCDPTIHLKGSPPDLFACVVCGLHFQTEDDWKKHIMSKVSSSSGGHSIDQVHQRIACFACPSCYQLFNLRDECLQHMSAKNHFTESLPLSESKMTAQPVPIPQHVKNRLITLCNDITFNVRCSLCFKILTSHQAAQAHFNVQCRQGCAVSKADKTITEVMKELQVRGQCSQCRKLFFSRTEIERHRESTQHPVEVNQTMQKALLQHSRFGEVKRTQKTEDSQRKRQSTGPETPSQKRHKMSSEGEEFPSRRKKPKQSVNGGTTTLWYCECGLQFPEEAAASKHLLAVNQIFHQCGVCGKHMGESSITRLHMSRFHGGAHLSNFLYYCRKCKVEMPRYQDILSHVSEAHTGHTYYSEQDVPEEVAAVMEAKPSISSKVHPGSLLESAAQQSTPEASPPKAARTWMCRMCEDIFDSEADIQKHCSDVNSHNFQRFICGHCPQKFFKESTVRRHCMNEHKGELKSFYFCGLCDSVQFESEGEFMEHYKSLHSQDYYCMNDTEVIQPTVAESSSLPVCPCMGSDWSKEKKKATFTQCVRSLSAEGKCQFVCDHCSVCAPSYPQMKTHVHTQHPDFTLVKTFDVQCKTCQETFADVPSFHKHYHSKHCALEPCRAASRNCKTDTKAEPSPLKLLDAVEITPNTNEIKDEKLVKFLNMEQANKETEAHDSDSEEEMNHSPSVSAEDAREAADLEEALKRSLLEF